MTAAANQAFIDAITGGFLVSIAFLVGALAVAAVLLPNQMRETQAEAEVAPLHEAPAATPTGAVAAGAVAAESETA